MLWIILCVITAAIYSITAFFDNYITDVVFAKKKPQSMKGFNGAGYLIFALLIAFFYDGLKIPDITTIAFVLLSGIITSISSIPYYIGLGSEEATGAAIFYQIQPVLYLLASVFIFGQSIQPLQITALILLMSAPIIIIFSRKQKKTRKRELKSGLLFGIYVILLVVSGLIYTHFGEGKDYMTCFMFFLAGRGFSDIILFLTHKEWQSDFKQVWGKKRNLFLKTAGINQLLCIVAEFTSRKALIDGDISIASALMNSLELILTFVLGILLTIRWPSFGREELHRHVIIAHLVATVACVAGIIILNLTGVATG